MKLLTQAIAPLLLAVSAAGCSTSADWRTASRESAQIAPAPDQHKDALIHVYGADAWGWRGLFATHTWIAAKRSDQDYYTVYDVVGWRGYRGQPVVATNSDIPDRYWYGAKPRLIRELNGEGVDALIDDIEQAVADYPWQHEYRAFPGPNSNTFVAWVGKQVPELKLYLPFSAIGSGYVEQYKKQ